MSNSNWLRTTTIMAMILLPTTSALAASVAKGETIYSMNCAMCHGESGKGSMPGTPDFTRKEGLFLGDLALVTRIEHGNRACPAYEGVLKQEDILDLIAYLRTL